VPLTDVFFVFHCNTVHLSYVVLLFCCVFKVSGQNMAPR